METKLKPPTRHLITDEILEVNDRHGMSIPFRVRIWLGKHATPVVLVSQIHNNKISWIGPGSMSARIANHINQSVLGHPVHGMLYFEDEVDCEGNWHLNQCFFEYFGNRNRLHLYKPTRTEQPWSVIEYIMSCRIER